MEFQKITLVFIFCIFGLTCARRFPRTHEITASIACLNDSVVIDINRHHRPSEITIYTLYSAEEKNEDTKCSRTFSQHEPPVKELKYNPCGARKFKVYVDEKIGDSTLEYKVLVDCSKVEADRKLDMVDLFSMGLSEWASYWPKSEETDED
ncbi:uncharacterized protein LOC130673091 [Microplitis mediator]|uniref:uncharacterized protein LOC130673091 n=1 Tax=Microplitis mediator TaxID=375433 RepID=UPI0025533E6C|nr:uncharacterized protein LOC130673091 [Microplitis mediator]